MHFYSFIHIFILKNVLSTYYMQTYKHIILAEEAGGTGESLGMFSSYHFIAQLRPRSCVTYTLAQSCSGHSCS